MGEVAFSSLAETTAAPKRASPPALDAAASVSDAFALIASSALVQLRANEDGALKGDDPEFLHQMRVGLRRLRSAISAFSDALPRASRTAIAKELKWLGRALGPARDSDVLVTQTLPPLADAYPEREAVAALAAEAARVRASAQLPVRRALRSRRYRKALSELESWLASHAWRAHAEGETMLDAPVAGYARNELEARYERVKERGRKLGHFSAAELHELRIAVKKLRYSTEFFGSLFDAARAGRLRLRLKRLQDVLGRINDEATMQELLGRRFGKGRSAVAAEARGILLGWSAARDPALKSELRRAWKAFRRSETRSETFW